MSESELRDRLDRIFTVVMLGIIVTWLSLCMVAVSIQLKINALIDLSKPTAVEVQSQEEDR
jgi:hypothetical protein